MNYKIVELKDAEGNDWMLKADFSDTVHVSFFKNKTFLAEADYNGVEDSFMNEKWFTEYNGAADLIALHFGVATFPPDLV